MYKKPESPYRNKVDTTVFFVVSRLAQCFLIHLGYLIKEKRRAIPKSEMVQRSKR